LRYVFQPEDELGKSHKFLSINALKAQGVSFEDEKILQALDDLRTVVHKQGEQLTALQDDVTAVKAETGKIPAIEQRLDHHGKLLTGLTANMATVLEEQQAQRSDIRSLHTEVHASREEVKGEIEEVKAEVRAAREEAKRDNIDLKAAVVKKNQSLDRRVTNLEEQVGVENPEKH
jgi:chromosome segregation ATPase